MRIHRETDPEDNARVGLPDGEKIEWPAMWVTELYAPSHAAQLTKGVSRLDKGNSSLFLRPGEPSEWIRNARSWTGGHWAIGEFVAESSFPFLRQRVGLPPEFKQMSATAVQVGPGVTVLSMCFSLSDESSASLDEVMRSSFETKVIPLGGRHGGHQIRGPEHRKGDEIAAERQRIRGAARNWLGRLAPGMFSSIDHATPPAWDLLLSSNSQIYGDTSWEEMWRTPLGHDHALDEWTPQGLDALRLLRPHRHRDEIVPAIVGLHDESLALLEDESRGSGLSALINLVDDSLVDHLALWTLLYALEACEDQFTSIRDQLAAPPGRLGSGKRLKRLRREVMPLSFDLHQLGTASQNDRVLKPWIRRAGTEFILVRNPNRPSAAKDPRALMDFLGERIREEGATTPQQGRDITDALRTQAELLLAATNTRLQWLVLGLTLIIGVTGIVVTANAS